MPGAASEAMREEDWTSLTSSIESGNCILMLGPDAFTADFDGEILPVAVGLARFVIEKLGPTHRDLDPFKPWSVAQVAVESEDANTLRGWAEAFYAKYDTVSEPLEILSMLPFPLVINTSPGLSAVKAFQTAKTKTYVDFYDRTAKAREIRQDPDRDAPIVYNLYGSLTQPSSLVLSENDRLEFLISVISGNPPLPTKLTSALCNPHQSFLFLGFNLGPWQLRMLMFVVLRRVQRDNKSFALELEREGIDDDAIFFYKRDHKVRFVDLDLATLTTELRNRVRQATPAGAIAGNGSAPRPEAPTVFICHAHEDAAVAERVAAGLQANDINVWLDKARLRGGDQWDAKIEHVLKYEVQYVVVLQSASLRAAEVSYVNKEISIACEQLRFYRDPRIFLIPAIIDGPDSALPELKEIQYVDLTVEDGIDDLVKAINRDLDAASRER